jgi:hypothetical protein
MAFANKTLVSSLILGSIFVAGCSGNTNPAEANLFENIYNLNNGVYDGQIASKEAQAAAIVNKNAATKKNIAAQQTQTGANAALIAALSEEIRKLQAQASSLRSGAANDPAKLKKISIIDMQISEVSSDLNGGGNPAVLRNEVAQIKAAISALAN